MLVRCGCLGGLLPAGWRPLAAGQKLVKVGSSPPGVLSWLTYCRLQPATPPAAHGARWALDEGEGVGGWLARQSAGKGATHRQSRGSTHGSLVWSNLGTSREVMGSRGGDRLKLKVRSGALAAVTHQNWQYSRVVWGIVAAQVESKGMSDPSRCDCQPWTPACCHSVQAGLQMQQPFVGTCHP